MVAAYATRATRLAFAPPREAPEEPPPPSRTRSAELWKHATVNPPLIGSRVVSGLAWKAGARLVDCHLCVKLDTIKSRCFLGRGPGMLCRSMNVPGTLVGAQ
ncbi:hypothetical protein MRX96_010404 [Rhipicephalus microplus]